MLNAFTVDLEDWYHTHDFNFPIERWEEFEDRIEYSTGIILDMLSKHKVSATFFVLGSVAERNPNLIRKIASLGHEIGSHGYYHRKINSLTPDEFRADLRRSSNLLKDITGQDVKLFRAPSWTISKDTLWALRILEEEGFICDSSIQPFVTPLSGMRGAPIDPFYPVVDGRELNILEFPPTVYKKNFCTIPFSGGFYLRAMPYCFLSRLFRSVTKERTGMIYIHPWEVDPGQPRADVPLYIKLEHYLNLKSTTKIIDRLLSEYSFTTLGSIICDSTYPVMMLESSALVG